MLLACGSLVALSACRDDLPSSALTPRGAEPRFNHNIEPHPRNAAALTKTGASASLSASSASGAIIGNDSVQLGINAEGHLNVPGGSYSSGWGSTDVVGLRYVPTNGEATAPGCLCEGWGVADASSGVTGYANVSTDGGTVNLTPVSFNYDPSTKTAVSVVKVGSLFEVTHSYQPSASPNLFQALVTIKNISASPVADVRYTRTMDWDISPNTFNEYVTIAGTANASKVLSANNNGFNSANPLAPHTDLGRTGDFTDYGPMDHGAHFNFKFGSLAPGATHQFKIFYGAAGNEARALAALTAVAAEVYSLGQANYDGQGWTPAPNQGAGMGTAGATLGTPHTYIFGFSGVGGTPVDQHPASVGIVAPPRVPIGETFGMTASLTGFEGSTFSYAWDFGADGTVESTSPNPTTSFSSFGNKSIKLTVTDNLGESATATTTVLVVPRVTVQVLPSATADSDPNTNDARCDNTVTVRDIGTGQRFLQRAFASSPTGPCQAVFDLEPGHRYVYSAHNLVISDPADHVTWPNFRPLPTDALPNRGSAVYVEASPAYSLLRTPTNYNLALSEADPLNSNKTVPIQFQPPQRTVQCSISGASGTTFVYSVLPGASINWPAAWLPFGDPPALSVYADVTNATDPCVAQGVPTNEVAVLEAKDSDGDVYYSLVAPGETSATLVEGPGFGNNELFYIVDPWGDNPRGQDDGGLVLFGLERSSPDVFNIEVHTRALQERGEAQLLYTFSNINGTSRSLQVKVLCSKQKGTCTLSGVLPDTDRSLVLGVRGTLNATSGNGTTGLRLNFAGINSARVRVQLGVGTDLDHLPNADLNAVQWTRSGGGGSWDIM